MENDIQNQLKRWSLGCYEQDISYDEYGRIYRPTTDNTKQAGVASEDQNNILNPLISNIIQAAERALDTQDISEKQNILELLTGLAKTAADYAFLYTKKGKED